MQSSMVYIASAKLMFSSQVTAGSLHQIEHDTPHARQRFCRRHNEIKTKKNN